MTAPQRIATGFLATLGLVALLGKPGVAAERPEWAIAPRLVQGQEFTFRGKVEERNVARGVLFSKSYGVETRALVLDNKKDLTEVGFLSKVTQLPAQPDKQADTEASSLRVEVSTVNHVGRITGADGKTPQLSLDGPTTFEVGFLTETPLAGVTKGHTWEVPDKGRSVKRYQVLGIEPIGNVTCVKVSCEQQSDDWDLPRGDSTAWRLRETLWIVPRLGIAQRLERTLEKREPARKEATYSLTTRLDLDHSIRYDGAFFEDRKREIEQAKQVQDGLRAILAQGKTANESALQGLLTRLDAFTEKHPGTPYREGLQKLRTQIVAATQHRLPAPPFSSGQDARLVVGQAAPDFVTENLTSQESQSLRNLRGKPLLLVFFQPKSELASLILSYAQQLAKEHEAGGLTVLGFSMSEDRAAIKQALERNGITLPILAGKGLRLTYGVEATPRFVMIDKDGVVRGAYLGWGPELPESLAGDFKKYLLEPTAVGQAGQDKNSRKE